MKRDVSAFKAYDIRGVYPDQIDSSFMKALAKAFATRFTPESIVIGYDARLSSTELAKALSEGFRESGVDVLDLGLCGTEMVYYTTGKYQTGGGIMITASHNPKEYNGCKIVSAGSIPVGMESGLADIKNMVSNNGPFAHVNPDNKEYYGDYTHLDVTKEFVAYVLSLISDPISENLTVVVNSGNGAAGPTINELAGQLPCNVQHIFAKPDGNFPNGVPNPLLPECREDTSRTVIEAGADLGVAFDGDFDRCFFFDEQGRFIEGYYIVGLLAQQMLRKKPGAKIIHDPRLTWNTIEIVTEAGGIPVISKTGHAFIKQKMREEDAEYGGEMSAHHYFRDFWYCDTGVYPFLLMLELLGSTGKPMSELVDAAISRYPVSGERNFTIRESPETVISHVKTHFSKNNGVISEIDGLSMDFEYWRFSLRASNTEPLLRLNVEARGYSRLMEQKMDEIIQIITTYQ